MSALTDAARQKVQEVIDIHIDRLSRLPGFVAAEPGFPLIDGTFVTKPAIIVLVSRKVPREHLLAEDRAPDELGGCQVHVMQADPVRQLEAINAVDGQNAAAAVAIYTYKRLDGNPIDKPFTVTKPLMCHVGPDAGWPVLKKFLNDADRELSVSIYDFNAKHIATTLIESALANKLEIAVNWDDSPRIDMESETFKEIRSKLKPHFRDAIVRTGDGRRFANSYHEKVAVRDSRAFWLSSGNWTVRSQPDIDPIKDPDTGHGMYGKYNREWHVIVNDSELAKLFETYIRYDFDQSRQEADEDRPAVAAIRFPDVFVPIEDVVDAAAVAAIPQPVAPKNLPAGGRDVRIQPVLTPDNYVDRVTALLESAKRSIHMQFAYITYSDAKADAPFTKMLNVLKKMSNGRDIDTKIIVGSTQAADKVGALVKKGFNQKVFRQQTNIHNKGIVVDGKVVLVSSANWSSDGILRNRDAGLIIHDRDIAGYYDGVFLDDWNHRASQIKEPAAAIVAALGAPTPPGMARISWEDYIGD
jgi:phosphatidylserine/phosphatidylglycerophosphate/cardiolipin synthase-like enzyme